MLTLSVLLNIVARGGFCYIVATRLTTDGWGQEKVDELEAWRLGLNSSSRQDQVCDEDASLSTDYFQMNINDEAMKYISAEGFFFSLGPVLCMLCITIWTITVSGVIRDTVDFLIAMKSLRRLTGPNSDQTFIRVSSKTFDQFCMRGLSQGRFVFACFIGFLQIFIACCLLV